MSSQELIKRFNTLSSREKEVAKLISSGLSTKAIAERLGLSDGTVYEHRREIYKKLGTKNVQDLLASNKEMELC